MRQIRALLVEHNVDSTTEIGDYLSANNVEIDFAYNGLAGLKLITENEYDVIILERTLPKLDGLTLCLKIRTVLFCNAPIMFLTAQGSISDKIAGFKAGADDYLLKPCENEELLCRIHALSLRGPRRDIGIQNVANLIINFHLKTVTCQNITVKLHYLQMNILKVLVQHYPNTVSRELLEQQIWGGESPDSSPLRTHIYRLRKALDKPFGQEIIETVYGQGYQIICES